MFPFSQRNTMQADLLSHFKTLKRITRNGERFFTTAVEKNLIAVEHSRTEDNDYGRIESRICYSVPLPDYLRNFHKDQVDLKSLACVIYPRSFEANASPDASMKDINISI